MSITSPSSIEVALEGKTIVIFGGTSGIGLAAAIQAKQAGGQVIVVGYEAARAEQVAAEQGFAGWRAADITKGESVHAALQDLERVDHLVLLAGTFVAGKTLEADLAYLQRAFEERVWGAIHALRALGNRISNKGSVTLISGALADRPNAFGTSVLAAASAAMEALARGLALELAPIRVNALSPGPTNTPILAKTLGQDRDGYVAALEQKLPLHRLGRPEEVGAGVVFLMSNGFMNGATLNVDGGSPLV
ncbi:SDR family oxidoreductase [Pseudomonas massiliensis]|uniref:SDR family oxidoreductase n=1 Tax=Pseudomonas massiliensis TaxID=522492 RepID=UPI0006934D96|nr:SDR family oxidoreductase [Pseudomonas massiliensis]